MENAIARKLDPPVINPVEIESVLLNRLASVGQKSYAEHMGISESTASRRKAEGHFSTMAKELAFLGIQAAPPEAVLVFQAIDMYKRMSQASRKGKIFDDVLRHAKLWAEKQQVSADRFEKRKVKRNAQAGLF